MSSVEEKITRVAITGPESTGKSTLAKNLASHYHTVWVPEYARAYIEKLDRPYRQHDLTAIAKGQIFHETELISKANTYLFCDTEMTVIKIWSEYKYGNIDPFIIKEHLKQSYDLYLLLDINLPWQSDGQRENPENRKFFFDWFERELIAKEARYEVVSGEGDLRFANACRAIDQLSINRK